MSRRDTYKRIGYDKKLDLQVRSVRPEKGFSWVRDRVGATVMTRVSTSSTTKERVTTRSLSKGGEETKFRMKTFT